MGALPALISGPVRAAEYVRMSGEHQKYSIANQQDEIRAFSARHDIEIVATYADEGRSGLNIDGRPALRRLLADAWSRSLNCELILVYDVTRWGRFQDLDEAAYYEFSCRKAGYRVIYCAEPFSERPGPFGGLDKFLKRAMAAEFSRELGVKTYAGQKRQATMGGWAGGSVGYALRRAILDENGKPQLMLEAGQWKNIKGQRVGLVLGPEAEVETVRRIFNMYVEDRFSMARIAAELNAEKVSTRLGGSWDTGTISLILRSERYIGTLAWGKRSRPLRGATVRRPSEEWVRVENALPGIIDKPLFERAQQIVHQRQDAKYSTDELIAAAKCVHQRHGRLTGELLDAARDAPGLTAYMRHFRSMSRIYELVGCDPPKRVGYSDPEGVARRHRWALAAEILRRFWSIGVYVTANATKYRLNVEGEFTIGLTVTLGRARFGRAHRWTVKRFNEPQPEFMIVACVDHESDQIRDYYVLPSHAVADRRFTWVGMREGSPFSAYRHASLYGIERLINRELPLAEDELEDETGA